jgi:hypothetical protein
MIVQQISERALDQSCTVLFVQEVTHSMQGVSLS